MTEAMRQLASRAQSLADRTRANNLGPTHEELAKLALLILDLIDTIEAPPPAQPKVASKR